MQVNGNMTEKCKENEAKLDAVAKEMQAFKLTIAQVNNVSFLKLFCI